MRPAESILVATLGLLLLPATAAAYGPMVHGARAEAWLESLGDDPLWAPLRSPELRTRLHMAAMLPDLIKDIGLGYSSHSPRVASHLLRTIAADPEAPLEDRVVAVGYASHAAADTSSQMLLVPYLVQGDPVGELDLLDGPEEDDAHPGYETELLVELVLDVYRGDVDGLLEVIRLGSENDAAEAVRAVELIHRAAAEIEQGAAPLGPLLARAAESFRGLAESVTPEREQLIRAGLAGLSSQPPGEVLRLLVTLAQGFDLSALGVPVGAWDEAEHERLRERPFLADRDYMLGAYDEVFGPATDAMLDDHLAGEGWVEWPVWRDRTMRASSLISLAGAVPDMAPAQGIGVWDAGLVVSDARVVTATARLFALEGEPTATLRVRRIVRDAPAGGGEVLAQISTEIGPGPSPSFFDLETAGVLLSDLPPHTAGLALEIAEGGDDVPAALSSEWGRYLRAEGLDLEQAPYALLHAGTYDRWPASLVVDGSPDDSTPPLLVSVEATPAQVDVPGGVITIRWEASDPESLIAEASFSAGDAPGLSNRSPMGSVGAASSGEMLPPESAAGESWWFSLRVCNHAGLCTDGVSNEVEIIAVPVEEDAAEPGESDAGEADTDNSTPGQDTTADADLPGASPGTGSEDAGCACTSVRPRVAAAWTLQALLRR